MKIYLLNIFKIVWRNFMSRIYNKYIKLKEQNKDTMYLFRNGNFYIFLKEDAERINEYDVLKKTKFCKDAKKCCIPFSSIEEYMHVFHNHGLDVQIISQVETTDVKEALEKLKNINLDKTTPIQALQILKELQELL